MRIYLDDCADSERLGDALRSAGHDVRNPRTERIVGADDRIHLDYAAQIGFIVLTRNPNDFVALHAEYQAEGKSHPDILLVYEDRIRSKNLSVDAIVEAIHNLESSGIPIENATHNLNHWR